MEETQVTCLPKYRQGLKTPLSSTNNSHLPHLDTSKLGTKDESIDNLDTFWQEAILDSNNTTGDLITDRLHDDRALDKRALTLSWVASHRVKRGSLTKSKSLEGDYESDTGQCEGKTKDPIGRTKSSEIILRVEGDEFENHVNNNCMRAVTNRRIFHKDMKEICSDASSEGTARIPISKNGLRSEQQENLRLDLRRQTPSPVLLPTLPSPRRGTPLSPLYLDDRLSPNGSPLGHSVTSSPMDSPVSTPRRHRQFQFLINSELSMTSKTAGNGAQSLPSSPSISKRNLILMNERRHEDLAHVVKERGNYHSKRVDVSVLPTSGVRKHDSSLSVHSDGYEMPRYSSLSARSDRTLHRPDTPISKMRCRVASGLHESTRLYSSCSDLPKVEENC